MQLLMHCGTAVGAVLVPGAMHVAVLLGVPGGTHEVVCCCPAVDDIDGAVLEKRSCPATMHGRSCTDHAYHQPSCQAARHTGTQAVCQRSCMSVLSSKTPCLYICGNSVKEVSQ